MGLLSRDDLSPDASIDSLPNDRLHPRRVVGTGTEPPPAVEGVTDPMAGIDSSVGAVGSVCEHAPVVCDVDVPARRAVLVGMNATPVLCGDDPPALLSSRAGGELASLRSEYEWASRTSTSLVKSDGRARWWTFAGTLANHELRWRLGPLADGSRGTDELSIPLREGTTLPGLRYRLGDETEGELPIDPAAVEELKFAECLPAAAAESVVRERVVDAPAVAACRTEPVRLASR